MEQARAGLVPTAGAGKTYARRQPEATALYRVMQGHLATFEQEWTDVAGGRTLPRFVTGELDGISRTSPLAWRTR